MNEREALKLALEHIEGNYTVSDKEAITAIKEALAQPEQKMTYQQAAQLINEMKSQPEQEPVIGTKTWFEDGKMVTQHLTAKNIYKDPEQSEQEPVAWYHQEEYKTHFTSIPSHDMIENGYWQPLYATRPQTNAYDNVLKAIDEMRPAARVIKDKPATWWLDEFEKVVRNLKENT